jgi:HEAT repeat protein
VTAARAPALAVAALLALACASKVARAPEPGEASRPPPAATAPSAPATPPPVGAAADGELDADIGALGDAAPARPQEAARRLEARGPAVVPRLLRELDLDRLGGVGRARILTVLAWIGDQRGLPPALASLDDKRSGVRAAAIDAVAAFRDPRATAALIRLLDDGDGDVVKQAALRLGERRDPAAVPRLGTLLASPDQGTRYSAALALSRVATPEARALLRGRLAGEADAEVRAVIVAGLGDGGAAR